MDKGDQWAVSDDIEGQIGALRFRPPCFAHLPSCLIERTVAIRPVGVSTHCATSRR